ncbi:hypothetical protein ACFVGP_03340 [Streptomyces rochei]|uniref:hypothetical protein n=1 Tax=Streptomyces TaxID=1883 RepID=UPI00163D14E1|nr:hypothetical protein [Streptomyces sp. WAC06273]
MDQTVFEAPKRKMSRLRRAAAALTLAFLGGIATALGRIAGAEVLYWLQALV